ncbi:heterokaryon incompatibility protein-domain-containing protein [Xylariaceae sp. FL0255]|nr:heterokaryon incompatibility protein-domain-containing protein [Xylariaceae sp. FL0255]
MQVGANRIHYNLWRTQTVSFASGNKGPAFAVVPSIFPHPLFSIVHLVSTFHISLAQPCHHKPIMRLINTKTLELKLFYSDTPSYAILSHVWRGDEEVNYQEWLRRDEDTHVREKSGYDKILKACKKASERKLEWIWVDTNCIDKTNPAELTEAINSMWEWYRESNTCFVYLYDVMFFAIQSEAWIGGMRVRDALSSSMEPIHSEVVIKSKVVESHWWTRGWTLQELLAPGNVDFFDKDWRDGGSRVDLATAISAKYNIRSIFMTGQLLPTFAASAEKMSWLSTRQTTKVEDMAYCMLGLFEINMPLLYGEGPRAFVRLQEEIIKVSDDHSIFCWTWNDVPLGWTSLLAPSPKQFADSSRYRDIQSQDAGYGQPSIQVGDWELISSRKRPYAMTNRGLSVQLPVVYTLTYRFVILNVNVEGEPKNMHACLPISDFDPLRDGDTVKRVSYPSSPLMLNREALQKTKFEPEQLTELIIPTQMQQILAKPFDPDINEMTRNPKILLFIEPEIMVPALRRSRDKTTGVFNYCDVYNVQIDTVGELCMLTDQSLVLVRRWKEDTYFVVVYFTLQNDVERESVFLFFAVFHPNTTEERWRYGVANARDIHFEVDANRDPARMPSVEDKAWAKQWARWMLEKYHFDYYKGLSTKFGVSLDGRLPADPQVGGVRVRTARLFLASNAPTLSLIPHDNEG